VRLALTSLEHEGLIEQSPSSGATRCAASPRREIADAIRVRGLVEGFAARLLAEDGALAPAAARPARLPRRRRQGGQQAEMELDDYAAYVQMNDRFHQLIMHGCGNSRCSA
jgi:GntR family transcriptional regulator of vanillate catabolism